MVRTFLIKMSGILACMIFLYACAGSPYGSGQKPIVNVIKGYVPEINWQPAGAHLVRVYEGQEYEITTGYGPDLMWSIAAQTPNGIQPSVTYGITPPNATVDSPLRPLVRGQYYTVIVTRIDTSATGDGFLNTGNTFEGRYTFLHDPL
jgi:hypothetical protein